MRGPSESAAGCGVADTFANFERRRHELAEVLAQAEDLARSAGEAAGADFLRDAGLRLSEARFTLAVFGEFKRGKSTLVNALLGADVMPVGVTPLTSLAVRVEHGAEPGCEVRFADGRAEAVALDRLGEYATERGNPANRKGVREIRVLHPSPILAHGMILVDTPGVGSIHRHSTREAHAFLPHADAAVFVLGVDAPAAEDEIAFLRRVDAEADRLFVVLNKADLLSPAELAEARAFVEQAIATAGMASPPPLFAISARHADAGFQEFRSALESFLVRDRATFLLERARRRAAHGVRRGLLAVGVERRSLALSSRELGERAGALRDHLGEIRRRRDEVESHLDADVRRLAADALEPAISTMRREGAASVRAAVEAEARGGGPHLARRLHSAADAELRRLLEGWSARLEQELGQRMAAIAARYAAEAGRLAGDVTRLAAGMFEVTVREVDVPAELSQPSRFSFRLEDQAMALELAATGLRRLVPGRLGRTLERRQALRRAEELVDRHAGRLHHDLTQRLDGHRRALVGQLRGAIDSAVFSVTGAIDAATAAQARGIEARVEAMTRLGERESRLRGLQERLEQA